MNENEFVTLPKWVGKVQVDLFPAVGGCTLLLLSDREMHILKEFVVPFAEWQSRFVRWLYGDTYQTATQGEYDEYLDVVGQLFSNIGGTGMDCTGLVTALESLASAIAQNQGGTTVNCGGCGVSGAEHSGIAHALAALPAGDILPEAPLSVDEEGEPPEGFATWDEFRLYKCRAAHQIWYAVDQYALTLQNMSGIALTSTIVSEFLLGFTVIFTTALTVTGFVGAIAAVLAIELFSIFALHELIQFREWWAANKLSVVCAMYNSGDAATALTAVSNAISDGVQAIEWTGALAPLSTELALAVGTIMSQVENNDLVNILFKLVTDVAFPEATCDCGAPAGFHFDVGSEGWTFGNAVAGGNTASGVWSDEETGKDGNDNSAGRLTVTLNKVSEADCKGYWLYGFSPQPVVHTGDTLTVDVFQGDTANKCRYWVRIGYAAGEDETEVVHHDSVWETHSVTVTAPHDGQEVVQIYVIFDVDYGQAGGPFDFAVDRAMLSFM